MPTTTIQYFAYEHLVGELRDTSRKIAELAREMEAKDCFVRAALEKKEA